VKELLNGTVSSCPRLCLIYKLQLRYATTLIVFVFNARDYVIRMARNLFTVLVGWSALKSITFVT